jgi:glycosyltransferase involved in cell wall biosynthesis
VTQLVVLNVAYPFAVAGPDAVGAAEQTVTQLDAALARDGHESIVMACEGSMTRGILLATRIPPGVFDETARRHAYDQYQFTLNKFLEKWPIDLIHMHGVDFYEYLPPPGVPVLVTLHLPVHWYPGRIFRLERPNTFLHCVSSRQRTNCPPCANLLPEIENGVAPELFLSRHARRNFAVTMGRICPEKGFHLALEAARRARTPLLLAGQVFRNEAHEAYFNKEISPRLDASRRFIGPVGFRRKRRLLSSARCLLAPNSPPETSSLIAMESLACGTPVIAFRSGALADIVEDGRTGFLVSNEKEMADAIYAAGSLDRDTCRQSALERFSHQRMIDKYFATYDRLATGTRVAEKPALGTTEASVFVG